MALIKIIFILITISFSLSEKCINGNFDPIFVNDDNDFVIGPEQETCYEYLLCKSKYKLGFVFPKINSTSTEVILYKSISDISMQGDLYQNYYDRFLMTENSFKEIDVTSLEDKIYIIIRDTKYPQVYSDTFKIYDSEIAISLINGKAITMKYFFSFNTYNFVYLSEGNLTLVYSSKVKLKKTINLTCDNETIAENQIDDSDKMFPIKSYDIMPKVIYFSVKDMEPGVEDQEFSVIVYERDVTEFELIEKNDIITLNYINLDMNDKKQTFLYYYMLDKDSTKSNTINFKLDPLANKTNYINIMSGTYHSDKKLNSEDFEKLFHFEENNLPIEYDLNSDVYKKIYFQDSDTSYQYRYIFFKIEISRLDNYYSPKNILISIGEEVEEIDFFNIYKVETITKVIRPYFPTYMKIKLNPNMKYIFSSPYPKNTIFVEGDLVIKDENQNIQKNNNYFTDKDEIIVLYQKSEITVSVFCSQEFKATFYVEKFSENSLYVLENFRNNEPFEIKFEANECTNNNRKYLLGIYDKEFYSKMNKTYLKYWTTDNGDMKVYYRNNLTLEGDSLFPAQDQYLIERHYFLYIFNHIDFFSFICIKPGTLTLRSPYKTFNESTYMIYQNSINNLYVGDYTLVLQLVSPVRPPTRYLYFALFSEVGKKIKISPDYPELFNETFIEGDQFFTLRIDLYKIKLDQMAVKIRANESTQIEVIEVVRYNFTKYTELNSNKMIHFTDNHFVKFLSSNTKKIKVQIKGLAKVNITYDLVNLFTDDINYLPVAYQFRKTVIKRVAKENDIFEMENKFYGNKDSLKKYVAFIFSIPAYKYYDYYAQIIEEKDNENDNDDNKSKGGIIVLAIIGSFCLIALISICIYFFIIKKKQNDNKYEMDVENISHPFEDENDFKKINDN